MQLDLYNISYLTFRLLPIILPSYFILSSIFAQDLKAFIYLAGLLFSTLFAVFLGNSFPNWFNLTSRGDTCNLITLNGASPTSQIPLSMVVYSYTFFYLFYVIMTYGLASQNIPTLVVFPILIVADFIWNISASCSTGWGIGASFIVGMSFGLVWALTIDRSKITKLQYFNGLSNRQYCIVPNNQTYKCEQS